MALGLISSLMICCTAKDFGSLSPSFGKVSSAQCQFGKLISPPGPFQCQYSASRAPEGSMWIWRSLRLRALATVQDTEYVSLPECGALLDNDSPIPLQGTQERIFCLFPLSPLPFCPSSCTDSSSCSASDLRPAKLTCPSSRTSRQVVEEQSGPHAVRSLGFELLQWLVWRGRAAVQTPCRVFITVWCNNSQEQEYKTGWNKWINYVDGN